MHTGCKHYRTDLGPNYTVILGSHRNRRLKMLVDGQTVVDMAGIVLCPSSFERYWISILDGRITVGKGEPGNHVLYEWSDTNPNCKVKYVGLSSWDKHVGYRNIRVLPPARVIGTSLGSPFDLQGVSGGLAPFLESAEFADIQFVVGPARQVVPAHRVLLASWCTRFTMSSEDVIWLPSVDYSVLHSFLQYMYTGRTQVPLLSIHSCRKLDVYRAIMHIFVFQGLRCMDCSHVVNSGVLKGYVQGAEGLL